MTTTPAASAPPRPAGPARSPWAVLAVLCLGLFMILLDGTIVNIAIPHILSYYRTTYSNIEWVMNAYILAFAVLLVPMGRFADLWGRRRLFLAGMVLFTLGSLACGLAPSISLLIAFRVLQGVGGAAMMPSTLSIITSVFPPEKRGAAMGVWGGVSGLASGLGPVLGGIIIQYVTWPSLEGSWRWIFLVNIPVGIAGVLLTLRLVPESRNPTAVESLDLPGVGLLSVSLFCLTFALIDFSLFRSLNFAAGNATGLLLSAAMMGAFFTIPIFLQSVLGFSAIKAGLVMAPMSVVIIFAAPLAGMLSDRLGSKWIVALGMLLLAVGLAWMAGLIPGVEKIDPQTTSGSLLVPFLISGVGIGFAVAPVTSAVMATAPRDRVGNASGVLSTMRQVGSLLGIAVLGAVLQNRVTANITEGVQAISQIPDSVKQKIVAAAGSGSLQMGAPQGASDMPAVAVSMMQTLFKSWFTDAIASSFIVAVVFAVVGGVCALLLRSHVRSAQAAAVAPEAPGVATAAGAVATAPADSPAGPATTEA